MAERARLSINAVGALERGTRLAPRRETVAVLAMALELNAMERGRFEAAARRARPVSARAASSATVPLTNLPRQLTSFLGREAEIIDLRQLLKDNSLVTIVGAGGIGKTRIALEVAAACSEQYPDGIWFADFSGFDDPKFIASRLTAVLGISVEAPQEPIAAVLAFLTGRRLLLIFDNCEHVIVEASRTATAILQSATGIDVLATSRERLGASGEVVYRLPTLSVPPIHATTNYALSFDSTALFAARAAGAAPDFMLTAETVPLGHQHLPEARGYSARHRARCLQGCYTRPFGDA